MRLEDIGGDWGGGGGGVYPAHYQRMSPPINLCSSTINYTRSVRSVLHSVRGIYITHIWRA